MGRPMVRVNEPAPESPVAELQKTQGALPSEAFATAADHLWTQRFGVFFLMARCGDELWLGKNSWREIPIVVSSQINSVET
jgi:hypothetical protein